ncbi:MAG: zinc-binding dehydrogenase [Pirellulaceae bacterium]
MSESLAAVFDGAASQIRLDRLPTPHPSVGEILVHVAGCTLCGSDLHSFKGRRAVPVPTVLGHEIVGRIEACGPSAPACDCRGTPLQIGDRVVWAIVASCGDCPLCRRGIPQKCLRGVKYGHEKFRPGYELLGGFAEHCLLVPGTSVVKLPEDLPLEVACPAGCATATVAAALEAAGPLADRAVCVVGAGMLGLTACAMSRASHAASVTAVDVRLSRRQLSDQFGATTCIGPEELAAAAARTPDRLGFDVVLELSGAPEAVRQVWPHVRVGGRIVLVGSVFPAPDVPLSMEQIVRRQLHVVGVHNYAPSHLVQAVQFLEDHHQDLPLGKLVSRRVALHDVAEAFACAADPNVIRVLVVP